MLSLGMFRVPSTSHWGASAKGSLSKDVFVTDGKCVAATHTSLFSIDFFIFVKFFKIQILKNSLKIKFYNLNRKYFVFSLEVFPFEISHFFP